MKGVIFIINKIIYLVNLDCANCAKKIEDSIKKFDEVVSVNVNALNQKMSLQIEENNYDKTIKKIIKEINLIEPSINIKMQKELEDKEKKQHLSLFRIIFSSIIFVISMFFIKNIEIKSLVLLLGYFIIGYDILINAIKNLCNKKILDENFLMSIATIGALILKEYSEAFFVMLFYQVGEFFQSYAVNKSRKSIKDLMDIKPEFANVLVDGKIITKNPEEVKKDDIIIVNIGEKIALDGIIIEGNSLIDTSNLTGESIPREVNIGEEVISGCINLNANLKIKVTKNYSESTVNKILDLIENASNKKSNSENFISKFSKYYTPIVVICASFLALFVPLILEQDFTIWINRALTFLVISCPCALVISVPLSFFGGIGASASNGVLVKGSNYLEAISKLDKIVFDKTGTLTKGNFGITKIHTNNISEDEFLKYASYAENYSNHPIAISIKNKYNKEIDIKKIKDVKNISGSGIEANIEERNVIVANAKYMKEKNIEVDIINEDKTIVYLAIDNKYKGYMLIEDEIKEKAEYLIKELKKHTNIKTIMLTGDNENTAFKVSKNIGIDEHYSQLLPDQKVEYMQKFINEKQKEKTIAFVGDGVNDAPVLALSDVGISMGAIGSDAAIEASDIVIMDDDISKILSVINISKQTMTIVKQNIILALSVKFLVLILGALGIASMWGAIFSDVGISVIAILNSMRTLTKRNI